MKKLVLLALLGLGFTGAQARLGLGEGRSSYAPVSAPVASGGDDIVVSEDPVGEELRAIARKELREADVEVAEAQEAAERLSAWEWAKANPGKALAILLGGTAAAYGAGSTAYGAYQAHKHGDKYTPWKYNTTRLGQAAYNYGPVERTKAAFANRPSWMFNSKSDEKSDS